MQDFRLPLEGDENYALVCYCAASRKSFLEMFRDKLSLPLQRAMKGQKVPWNLGRFVVPNRR